MEDFKMDVKLTPGENIVFKIEADFWQRGNNPLQKIVGNFMRIFSKILGYRVNGALIVTNKRVLELTEEYRCWCINTNRGVKVLTRRGVKEFGYEMEKTCGIFCPTYYLYYEGDTQSTLIAVQDGSDQKMMEILEKFQAALEG
ncbi:MAG TPA: hypothetical protein PLF85_10275 [Turneriella sp.]|nr:hypothetical protein [Turneriella sp.]